MTVITANMLRDNFSACRPAVFQFRTEYPDGIDISPLWGTDKEAEILWQQILGSWLRQYVGWGICCGVLPAFIRANLSDFDLRGADLTRALMRFKNWDRVNLEDASLQSISMFSCTLNDAQMRNATLYGANLDACCLRHADLRHVALHHANLSRADLRGATLQYACLHGANLEDALLLGTDLRGADLRQTNLFRARLDVLWNEETLWPKDYPVPKEKTPCA